MRSVGKRLLVPAAAGAGLVLIASPAYAIPSPDLAVNFFANIAQLLGLATAVVGGAVVGTRGGGGRKRGGQAARRFPGWGIVALVCLFVGSVAINVLQWGHHVDDRERRLQTNLVRSSVEGGHKVGDTSLKTLAYSSQLKRKDGITDDELETLLRRAKAGDKHLNLLDVREPEEREAGRIGGFTPAPYADLMTLKDKNALKGRENVLMCYSGNRSSELCSTLEAAGISCRFLIGGFEKWVADGRKALFLSPGGKDARGLPDYPHSDTLLDTPDVTRLVRDHGAVFVDVRYPHEFAVAHLPGAINIPIRKMPSAAMWAALKRVPHRPVIAPCYDKRSCFYAKLVGLRLHRLGYDYRGRYTVPSEFVPVSGRAAAALRGGPSLVGRIFGSATALVDDGIGWLNARSGSLLLSILIAVLIFRIIVAPFTAKSERDQTILRHIESDVEKCNAIRQTDPRGYARSLRELYRRHRLSPGFNVIGVLLQVPLFVVLFESINHYARAHQGSLLWAANATAPDPIHILPIGIGALVFLHLWLTAKKRTLMPNLLRGAAGVGLAAITFPLAAAVNAYLVFSILLMLLQAAAVRALIEAGLRDNPNALRLLPLAFADNHADCGAKAARLGRMKRAGLPVPGGFVVFGSERACRTPRLRDRWRLLIAFWRLRAPHVAVRSSGANEDGANRSYAGVFDTVLNVQRDRLLSAIQQVRSSMSGERAGHYSGERESGGVVVQAMVPAKYAGVVFTRHPADAAAGIVELIEGLGDKLVDGSAVPHSYRFSRVGGEILDDEVPPIDLGPLLALARQVEVLFGRPQDIEWCFAGGRFHLLQSRDITAVAGNETAIDREQDRLIGLFRGRTADEAVLVQNEVSEILPRPTPLSLSLLERLWAPGGSVEHAFQALGMRYDASGGEPYLVTVLGRLYVNCAAHEKRFGRGPGPWTSFRIARNAEAIERQFRESFLPDFEQEMRVLEAVDPSRLDTPSLLRLLRETVDRFAESHYAEAHIINVVSERYVNQATRTLERRKLPVAQYLASISDTVVHEAMALLARSSSGDMAAREDFLRLFGHRSVFDYELAEPRYNEMAELPYMPSAGHAPHPDDESDENVSGWIVHTEVERARRFQSFKEEAKHHCLKELAVIRRLLLELDRRFHLDGAVFYLTLDEALGLEDAASGLRAAAIAARRRDDLQALYALPEPPREMIARDLECLGRSSIARARTGEAGQLAGTIVAGTPPVEGRARIASGEAVPAFEQGEILVVRSLHPDLVATFGQIAGVVSEIGGWLSHAAILAREYGIPTLVGVKGATERIATGDHIRVEPDGTVSIIQPEVAAAE